MRRAMRPSHTPVCGQGLNSACSQLARRLGVRFCRRLRGPAFHGCWHGRPARASRRWLAAARAHEVAIDRVAARDLSRTQSARGEEQVPFLRALRPCG